MSASGAIAGVLGAYLLLFPTARLIVLFPILFFPFFFELPAVLYLGLWFSIQLFSGALALAVKRRRVDRVEELFEIPEADFDSILASLSC